MAITPTGAIFKTLSFDGASLRSYGVYISGEATFNAPAREVEMISIPGRSGQLALDKGRFENIEVTYPAGIYADTEEDFAEAVSELRNFLCSRSGYCRIEDDYNPNEFRMGIYKSGLEVTPALLKAGEFDLVFDCKPQRWLNSGEDEIDVQDGDTITNPTLFESSPMLQVWGYGAINLNESEITVNNAPIGMVVVHGADSVKAKNRTITFDDTYANIGDSITCDEINASIRFVPDSGTISGLSISTSGDINDASFHPGAGVIANVVMKSKQFVYGTPATLTGTASLAVSTSVYGDLTIIITATIAYDGTNEIVITFTPTNPSHVSDASSAAYPLIVVGDITLDSTKPSLGHPIYIDLDVGECYKVESGSVVSVNDAVQMPTKLPTLSSGLNTITFDNTITALKIIPRWWIV